MMNAKAMQLCITRERLITLILFSPPLDSIEDGDRNVKRSLVEFSGI